MSQPKHLTSTSPCGRRHVVDKSDPWNSNWSVGYRLNYILTVARELCGAESRFPQQSRSQRTDVDPLIKPSSASPSAAKPRLCPRRIPTLIVARGVDESRRLLHFLVLLRHRSGHWRVQFTGSLHTLQGSAFVVLTQLRSYVGQLGINYVSQGILKVE